MWMWCACWLCGWPWCASQMPIRISWGILGLTNLCYLVYNGIISINLSFLCGGPATIMSCSNKGRQRKTRSFSFQNWNYKWTRWRQCCWRLAEKMRSFEDSNAKLAHALCCARQSSKMWMCTSGILMFMLLSVLARMGAWSRGISHTFFGCSLCQPHCHYMWCLVYKCFARDIFLYVLGGLNMWVNKMLFSTLWRMRITCCLPNMSNVNIAYVVMPS